MFKGKRFHFVLAFVLILALVFTGCTKPDTEEAVGAPTENNTESNRYNIQISEEEPAEPLKIAVLAFQNNPYWLPVRDGVVYAAELLEKKNTKVDWIVVSEEFDATKMVNAIDTAIVQQYDGIICVAFEDAIVPTIDKAVDAGIPVFTMDSDPATKSKRMAFFGQDYYHSGELAAEYLGTALNGEGKVGIITGVFGASCPQKRMDGFKAYIEKNYPEMEVVGEYENNDKADLAYNITKNLITANPDLAGVYVTAGGPFGAARAVQELKLEDQVKVVGHDFIDENFAAIDDGSMAAAIGEDPFQIGFDPVASMYNYLVTGTAPEKEYMTTNMQVMTTENKTELLESFQ